MTFNSQITTKRNPEYGNSNGSSGPRSKSSKSRIVMMLLGIVSFLYVGMVIGYRYYMAP